MPRTHEPPERVNVRLPKPLVEEVDKICREYKGLSYNRQQFIEVSVREKVERTLFIPKGKIQRPAKGRTQPSA